MAIKAVKERVICIRLACQAFRITESCYRYERKLDAENEEVATWLIKRMFLRPAPLLCLGLGFECFNDCCAALAADTYLP
jgi:hypothetical protein